MARTKVVIIGGGFGGLNAALALKKAEVDILLIDRTNHHLFQPLLYQVASAALSPADIATPIRAILRNSPNTSVIMGDVVRIDKKNKQVTTQEKGVFDYDYLIVATGSRHAYFGNEQWEKAAPGLKTIPDAINIRERILIAFEHAEICENPADTDKFLTFVIIGGGPTGVEMAGAIAEIANRSLYKNFRKIDPSHSHILLIEGTAQVLPGYPERLAKIAQKDLERLGVTVMTNTFVTNVTQEGISIGDRFIECATTIWAAGNQASPLLKTLDVPLDRQGRLIVAPDLSVPGSPDVFVIGDAAHSTTAQGKVLPGIAPVAIQQGKYVANLIKNQISQETRKPFRYFDKGMLATIGKTRAVGVLRKVQFSGFLAWMAWSAVHIFYLISFRNRLIVAVGWLFLYLSGGRTVRLITRSIESEDKRR